ncbi:prepilin-type N-terminal cleavage/methylation domain-containing protein [Rickettsiella endosymbiont of Dermanyssus gallinae]|uniref:prepilin-type N-terminal cleavage/methylation domain-containing protein n=1 Tax=Rickettsiella endosymbiont of Dermanyssus gallinae TaxID=2856608 RepID=UPI001C5333F1|nr:prepilin-type N-terminal cleavage/methylation domain-containing protein [Rickettsiella endosymbiont of Dermanyssus gallinae]
MKRAIQQQGHTLLELLIALTLALFLSGVLIEIFVQCKKTYFLTQRLQVSRYAPEEFRPSCPRNSFA